MLIVFASLTGNVRRFVAKLDMPNLEITQGLRVNEPFVLVTYTTGFGQVPDSVASFLEHNHELLIGVSASGNRNWGANFAIAADVLSNIYKVPIISKFELSGTQRDLLMFREGVSSLVKMD